MLGHVTISKCTPDHFFFFAPIFPKAHLLLQSALLSEQQFRATTVHAATSSGTACDFLHTKGFEDKKDYPIVSLILPHFYIRLSLHDFAASAFC